MGIYGSSQTTGQSSSSTVDARSLSLVGMGGMSVGMSGGSVVLSCNQTAAQSNQSEGLYAVGNTTGQSSSSTYDARTMSVAGAGIVSVGLSAGSGLVVSASQSNQTGNIYLVSQSTAQSSSSSYDHRSLSIAGMGGVSVGMSAGSLVISGGAGGGAGFTAGFSTDGQTSGNSGMVTGQLDLVGTNGIGLSGSTNGGSISVSVMPSPYISNWAPVPFISITNLQFPNASMYVVPVVVQWPVTATAINQYISVSISSSSNSSHAGTLSFWGGMYTRGTGTNSNLLMSATTGSTNWQWTVTSSNSINSIQGMRQAPVTMNINMTPGEYWYAFISRTSSAGNNWATASNLALTNANLFGANGVGPPILAGTTGTTIQFAPGFGYYSLSTAGLPASIGFSDIQCNLVRTIAWFEFCNVTF
jgi:hypothetical protein